MLGTILIVTIVLLLPGALLTWPHSRQWGYLTSRDRLDHVDTPPPVGDWPDLNAASVASHREEVNDSCR